MSAVVRVDAIGIGEMNRLSNLLMALAAGGRLRVETVYDEEIYDEERADMKIIVLGGLTDTAELLKVVDTPVGREGS